MAQESRVQERVNGQSSCIVMVVLSLLQLGFPPGLQTACSKLGSLMPEHRDSHSKQPALAVYSDWGAAQAKFLSHPRILVLGPRIQHSLPWCPGALVAWWCPMTMVVYHDRALQETAVAKLTRHPVLHPRTRCCLQGLPQHHL